MSKSNFAYALIDQHGKTLEEKEISNNPKDIKAWILTLEQRQEQQDFWSSVLVCLEHSGHYATPLLYTLQQQTNCDIWLESAVQIKRSIGLQRGKNDRIDALRIASYALDFQRKATLWQAPERNIERLGLLLSHRDRTVKYLMSLRTTLNEEIGFIDAELHLEVAEISDPAISALETAVAEFDRRIEALISSDIQLARQREILLSIPGFGPIITSKIIQITRGFTRLDDPRKLACFAGVAPFEHSSGSSVRGRTRVSHLANKDLKKMLHLAALVTIRKGNIMRDYFERKVKEGKNKMSVINAVRNKLVHILAACIRNDVTYQKNYKVSGK